MFGSRIFQVASWRVALGTILGCGFLPPGCNTVAHESVHFGSFLSHKTHVIGHPVGDVLSCIMEGLCCVYASQKVYTPPTTRKLT